MKKILAGSLAYIVFTFAIAFIWNMILFRDNYQDLASQSLRENPMMPLGVMAIILESLALSGMFCLFFKGNNPVREGLSIGLMAGTFSITYAAMVVPAKFVIEPVWEFVTLELVFGVIHFGVAGIILAFIFRKQSV